MSNLKWSFKYSSPKHETLMLLTTLLCVNFRSV
jgi:hypothetical protein